MVPIADSASATITSCPASATARAIPNPTTPAPTTSTSIRKIRDEPTLICLVFFCCLGAPLRRDSADTLAERASAAQVFSNGAIATETIRGRFALTRRTSGGAGSSHVLLRYSRNGNVTGYGARTG